ncbi:MAG: LamG domain-containing protein [Nanoarchaeota archaeon]|nr:LamG domain-containing protein [Nanoarchaeota archaeon]
MGVRRLVIFAVLLVSVISVVFFLSGPAPPKEEGVILITDAGTLFKNPDGTYTAQLLASPPRPHLETMITEDEESYTIRIGKTCATFLRKGTQIIALTIGEQYLSLGGVNITEMPITKGNKVTYPNLFPGVDAVYETFPNKIKESLVIKEPPSEPLDLSFLVEVPEATPSEQEHGDVVFLGNDGTPVVTLFAPVRTDADGNTVSGSLRVLQEGGAYRIVMDGVTGGLGTAAYPVVIDPTLGGQSNGTDSSGTILLQDGYVSQSTWVRTNATTEVRVGHSTQAVNAFFDFDTDMIPNTAYILQVNLSLYIYAINGDGNYLTVFPLQTYSALYADTATGNEALYTDAENGTVFLNQYTGYPSAGNWDYIILNKNASTYVQDNLSSNFFSIGITGNQSSGVNLWLNASESTNVPSVNITYTLPPELTINEPANATVYNLSESVLFNLTPTDDNTYLNITIYADNTTPGGEDYIARFTNIVNNTNILFNWSTPLTANDSSTIFLYHFDNRTVYGETHNEETKSGSIIYDFTNHGLNGTGQMLTFNDSGGMFGGAFLYNATTGASAPRIQIGGASGPEAQLDFEQNENFTIMVWVKLSGSQGVDGNFYGRFNVGGSQGYAFGYDDVTGKLLCSTVLVTNYTVVDATTSINDSQWHLVACTRNISGSGAIIRIYIDGILDGENTSATMANVSSDGQGYIGTLGVGGTFLYSGNGSIDEVSLWNRTLSQKEILFRYRLQPDLYRWEANVSDSGGTVSSGAYWFIVDQAPNVTLVFPENTSVQGSNTSIYLNFTVYDDDGQNLTVEVFGTNGTVPSREYLLYRGVNVTPNSSILVNYSAPVTVGHINWTVLLFHLDNQSAFGERSSLVYDFSGKGHNGATSLSVNATGGRFGGSFDFVSVNNTINVSDENLLDIPNGKNFTYAAWIRANTIDVNSYIFYKVRVGEAPGLGYSLYLQKTSYTPICTITTDNGVLGTTYSATGTQALNDSAWHFVACVIDGTNGNISVYIDGLLNAYTLGVAGSANNGVKLFIGGTYPAVGFAGSATFFNGSIDEISIWNRTLSEAELRPLFRLIPTTYYVNVTVADGLRFFNTTWQFRINSIPEILNLSITSDTINNESSGNLTGNFTYVDQDGDSQVLNETKWFQNDQTVPSLDNQTYVQATNLTKNDSWIFSVRVYDGGNWSAWTNYTINITNAPPTTGPAIVFNSNLQVTSVVLQGERIFIRSNVTDMDGVGNISSVTISIWDQDGDPLVSNQAMNVNSTLSSTTRTYQYTYDVSGTAVSGVYPIMVVASDGEAAILNTGFFAIATEGMKLIVTITLNNTDNTVLFPGYPPTIASGLTSKSDFTPDHFFVASNDSRTVTGLVFSERNPWVLVYLQGTENHSLVLSAALRNSQYFLAFTKGSWINIEKRMPLIETGDFLTKISPSFSFTLGTKYVVRMILKYLDINLVNSLAAKRGQHNIIIESLRNDTAKALKVTRG